MGAPSPSQSSFRLGRFDRLVRGYQGWSAFSRAVVGAAVAVSWVALGAIFVPGIVGGLTNSRGTVRVGTLAVTLVVLMAVVVLVAALQYALYIANDRVAEGRRAELAALRETDPPVLRAAERLETFTAAETSGTSLYVPHCPRTMMQDLVDAVWSFLHNRYGELGATRRVEFEVAFMPLSYIDGEVTIAAFASDHGRSAPSMAARASNPTLFRPTETFKMFSEQDTSLRIVPDTAKPAAQHAEIRPGQHQRLKSSALQPVVCRGDQIIATLVLSCDQSGFFASEDALAWRRIAEPFAHRLALEKLRLDGAVESAGVTASPIPPLF